MNSIPSTPPPDLAVVPRPPRGAKAARDFEASLILSLFSSLERTFAAVPGEDRFPGADDYSYLGSQALAQELASHGGFGIADLILRHLPHESTPAKNPSATEDRPSSSKVMTSIADTTR